MLAFNNDFIALTLSCYHVRQLLKHVEGENASLKGENSRIKVIL